jgi:hypothetical protein
MSNGEKIHRLLCLSQLAPTKDLGVFKQIAHVSRQTNRERHLTGVLLFDGGRFCHLLEGPQASIEAVWSRVSNDPRHTALSMLYPLSAAPSRLLYTWRSGYCNPEDLDILSVSNGHCGDEAMLAFLALLTHCDLSG